jgi:hypothetical protein
VPTANAVPAPASGSSLRTNPIVRPLKLAFEEIIHIARQTDQPRDQDEQSDSLLATGYAQGPSPSPRMDDDWIPQY